MMKRRTVLAGLSALPLAWLAGCGGGSDGGTRVRLLNASRAYGALDLYVEGDRERSDVAYATVSGYVDLDDDGGTYTLALTRAGSGTYIVREDQSIDDRTSYTLVAYGAEGSLATVLLAEDEDDDDIDSGDALIQVINTAADAGTLDVYLTGEDEGLTDAIALAADVAVVSGGEAGGLGYLDINAGTYRLRVTGAGDKDDLRLDVSGFTLGDKQIGNLVISGTVGGVLVDAMLLDQEGELVAFANPSARLRLVAGVADNAVVSATVGEETLSDGVSAPTVGAYVLVPAGTPTPQVNVNGAALFVEAFEADAGGDYTLLVFGEAAAPQAVVLADDNRLPSNAEDARLRLVHAVAGVSGGLTLTVNFGSLASGVGYGTASAYAEQTPGTDLTLEVTAAGTGVIFSRDELTLLANSVYTVFMLGDAAAPAGQLLLERDGGTTTSTPVPTETTASSPGA